MKLLFKYLFLSLLLPSYLLAQTSGYFGKKNLIDFNTKISNPFYYNLTLDTKDDFYKVENNKLVQKKDLLDYSFSINYNRILSNRFSVGIEYMYEKFDHAFQKNNFTNLDNNLFFINGNHERLLFESYIILPKIQYNKKTSFLPIGIFHELAIGVRTSKLVEKDYLFEFQNNYYDSDLDQNVATDFTNSDIKSFQEKFYNFSQNSFRTYLISYSFNMRKPITKFLLFNYGFVYTYNISKSQMPSLFPTNKVNDAIFYLKNDEVDRMISNKKLYNIMQFRFGLTLVI